ncbi:MAG: dihydroorotase family protein [Candidatus Micrarchaeia archaeon]
MSLLIRNGKAFLNGKFEKKDLLLDGGKIVSIGGSLKAGESIDAGGMLVLPGLIDPHVHLREPGDTYKEDFVSGTRAAISGGFTTVMDMPNNAMPTVTRERLAEKARLAREKAVCDVLFHFGGTDSNFDEVKKADPGSLKLYLGRTTGDMILKEPFSMEKHFLSFPKDRPIVLHACDHSEEEEESLERTYRIEEDAVAKAASCGRRIHIAHASTWKEIQIAKRYARCTVEVAPHHLFLSSNDRERLGPLSRVYPPLRSERKRIGLWSALEMADCIATDHAPHTIEDKEKGAAGFPGLETSLALMLHGCDLGLIDRIWVVQRMSESVASAFNLYDRGRLEKGLKADVTIVDPKKVWEVDSGEMESKCKWTPFDGMKLKGKVHTVIRDGVPVFQEYAFI